MNIKYSDFGSDTTVSVPAFVGKALDGQDYERGQLEALEASSMNTMQALGRLIDVLACKGILTAPEILDLVASHCDSQLTATLLPS